MRTVPDIKPIELEGEIVDIQYFLKKEYDDVDEASVELPALIEWISSKLQGIVESKFLKENSIQHAEAKLWHELLNGGFEDRNYAGKKTGHNLTMALRLDDNIKKLKDEVAILSGWQQRLENLIWSLRSKQEIVRSVEATRRSQLSSTLTQETQQES